MFWIFAAVALVLVVYSKGCRNVFIGLLVIAGLGGYALYQYAQRHTGAAVPAHPVLHAPPLERPNASGSVSRTKQSPAVGGVAGSKRGTAGDGPTDGAEDTVALSADEAEAIDMACLHDQVSNGPLAYRQCRSRQIDALRVGPRTPDLSALQSGEKTALEFACNHAKVARGPVAFNQCLLAQLASLSNDNREPSLAGIDAGERDAIEFACLHDQVANGPAAYNRCLRSQLKQIGIIR